jgi:hypothetical protein
MRYFVKRTSQTGVLLPHPVTYSRPSAAMKYACVAIGSGITDIWIEDDEGCCIADRAKIEAWHREHPINPTPLY